MPKDIPNPPPALELVMRDVRDGLMEAVCQWLYDPHCSLAEMTILSIEPPDVSPQAFRAQVHPLPHRRSSDVLSYLLERERQFAAS